MARYTYQGLNKWIEEGKLKSTEWTSKAGIPHAESGKLFHKEETYKAKKRKLKYEQKEQEEGESDVGKG